MNTVGNSAAEPVGSMPVEIREVGLRDGLQSVTSIMATEDKKAWIRQAYLSGLRHIEVGSFVSPKLLPQLADTAEIARFAKQFPDLRVAALVPNLKGATQAVTCGVDQLTVPVSMTEAHSMSNLRRDRDTVVADARRIVEMCAELPISQRPRVEASMSMSFGCTQQGAVTEDAVIMMAEKLAAAGVDELRPADTVGYGNPTQLRSLVRRIKQVCGEHRVKGVHLHNSRGQGLAMVVAALEEGLYSFDASLGGLGGCPFAPGASGNIVTEDLAWLLESMGYATGVNMNLILSLRRQVAEALPEEELYGFLAGAGLPKESAVN